MRKKSNFKYFLILFIFLLSINVSYAYLQTSLEIKGTVSGNFTDDIIIDKDSNPNLEYNNLSVNNWREGNHHKHQFKFFIKNTSDKIFDNYQITLNFNGTIIDVSIWNYDYKVDNNIIKITGQNTLAPNQEREVNFIITSDVDNLKITRIKMETNLDTEEVTDDMEIIFAVSNSWGNYHYQYNVTVINKTGKKISFWEIALILPSGTTHQGGWNAIFENNNNILTIKNASYNGIIENNQSTSFGLHLFTNEHNYLPNNYNVMVR